MFDTLNDILTSLLEPIGETGRNVILVVAAALLVAAVISALVCLARQRWMGLILSIVVAIGIGILGTQGYNVVKKLGDKQGDDFKGQINTVYSVGLIPSYLLYRKSKSKKSPNEK
ncbi:hypothetical protein [Staphylococcus pettenkoferi]|uniref:hypothetical protein n=1 Tax=Staphylococcus pettenkoferi TaxID=170573 RepID=UPI002553E880|nr:hypothetical protein [Staphylococcus pettenkoferi]MDK7284298.1 hypothetical protein [Staphylococcus pettenkoferi]